MDNQYNDQTSEETAEVANVTESIRMAEPVVEVETTEAVLVEPISQQSLEKENIPDSTVYETVQPMGSTSYVQEQGHGRTNPGAEAYNGTSTGSFSNQNQGASNMNGPSFNNATTGGANASGQTYRNPTPGGMRQEGPQGGPRKNSKPKKKKKMPKALSIACLALLFGVVGSVTFQGTNMIGSFISNKNGITSSKTDTGNPTTIKQTSSTVVSDVSKVVEKVMPSVVSITNMSVQQVQNYFGDTTSQESESSGSGIIIGKNETELLIVTNNHVVAGSNTLTVTFADDNSIEAQIKGTNATKDLAVVAVKLSDIKEKTMDAIVIASLGDSTTLQVGEPAIAIGNALGYGQSVTTGVISATDRTIAMEGFDVSLIQTDAAINPGNSGGALVNVNGEVVGINTVKVSASAVEGMGYAIPVSDVSDTITELMNKETKSKVKEEEKGYIGITGVDVTEESSQMYSMPAGVYVSEVVDGKAAKKAGITKGSIITELEGTAIKSMQGLQEELAYYGKGETVNITVQVPDAEGGYKEEKLKLTLGEKG